MRRLKATIRTIARGFGVEIARYPRSDQLIQQWIDRLRAGGPVECVFDVGANRGQTVARFRSWIPGCSIYAFEPAETAYRELVAATKDDLKVWPVRAALGECDGSATLHENAADVTNSLLPNSSRFAEFAPADMGAPVAKSTVPLLQLDTFCARENITRIDILKIDAQGYERRILEGAGALLAPQFIRGIFMEVQFVNLYEGQAWGGELLELLRARGYKFFGFTEITFDHANGWKWADAMFLPDQRAR